MLNLTTIQHYFLKNDVGYVLTFTIKEGEESVYLPLAEEMLSTFKIHD